MIYRGMKLEKYPEIIDYALSLAKPQQEEFVETYAKTGPYALSNIGYFSGYYDREKATRIMEVFKTAHPIFGRRHPAAEECFKIGFDMGSERKAKG